MNYIYYVYQYLREDGYPYYIGMGKGNRAWAKHHKGVNPPKDKMRIRIVAHNLYQSEAFILECKLIAMYGRKDLGTGILRNMTDGGSGPSNPSIETRFKMGISKRGKITSLKTRQKISKKKIGKKRKPFTEQAKKNMSECRKGVKKTPMSEQGKKNISDSKKGVPNPKHSDVMKGRPSNNKGKTLKKHKCKYCGIEAAGGNIARWHNENCSNKSSSELHNE